MYSNIKFISFAEQHSAVSPGTGVLFFNGRLLTLLDVPHVGTEDNTSSDADFTTPDTSHCHYFPIYPLSLNNASQMDLTFECISVTTGTSYNGSTCNPSPFHPLKQYFNIIDFVNTDVKTFK